MGVPSASHSSPGNSTLTMDVSQLLTDHASPVPEPQPRQAHPYPTRSTIPAAQPQHTGLASPDLPEISVSQRPTLPPIATEHNPPKLPPKAINFQLMLSHIPLHRARLPLRVHIQPHDTTDSIITTVKNFYGLYEGEGVSFEDGRGLTLIARYENLANNSTVFVRVMAEEPVDPLPNQSIPNGGASPQKPYLDEPFQAAAQPLHISRPSSRTMKNRDASPQSAISRRSFSARPLNVARPRNLYEDQEAALGLSDSDGGSVSVSSSRKTKSDHLASAEISLDNIVEGGRRKRAKFESSELPLFAPPQQPMTTSMSSLSPQRRFTSGVARSPLQFNNQYTFSYTPAPLPSPQSFGNHEFLTPKTVSNGSAQKHVQAPVPLQRLRARASSGHGLSRLSGGAPTGVLATPDPTTGSAISDEDVAWHLMRLGDPSNQSHGRTSNSTADDALSGKAEVASSVEGSSDDARFEQSRHKLNHHGVHTRKRQKGSTTMLPRYSSDESSVEEYENQMDGIDRSRAAIIKSSKSRQANTLNKAQNKMKMKPSTGPIKAPAPYSKDVSSRKGSNASSNPVQQQLAEDEEDLSAKPRCQRCRKSKKGCDRQRPCQRCKDAGIGVEGCISEDEGNGRKGRYGRHMGVSVKKPFADAASPPDTSLISESTPFVQTSLTEPGFTGDNAKKRKR